MLPQKKHIEVREKQNGTWAVFYPDPGFIPCPSNCELQKIKRDHKHDREPLWIETNYKPEDFDDAMAWAKYLADDGEVKVVKYLALHERRSAAAAARRATKV